MEDDIQDIRAYYDKPECGEDSRLVRHQLERDITLRHLEAHLPATGRILEIGAATGGYTTWLAERGYQVTAVELSENQVKRCRERLAERGLDGRVRCFVADARDLSSVPGGDFDAVLLMGPLYHLTVRENRILALREAVRRLTPGGILVSSLISRFGILGHLLRHVPQWIENHREVRSVLERGHDPADAPKGGFHGYYVTVDEIVPLHEEAGLQTIVVAGVEPAISADDESYNRLEGDQRRLWLDLLYQISREPSLVASSRHLLYVGRRPAE
jgi:SAM-dependent methyltransferase